MMKIDNQIDFIEDESLITENIFFDRIKNKGTFEGYATENDRGQRHFDRGFKDACVAVRFGKCYISKK
jgi:hypothetical protein